MPRLLVCQHVAWEILNTLDPLLRRAGFRIRYVNFGRHPEAVPSLDGYHGLVILGGPMSVSDAARHPHITTEMRLVEAAMTKGIPVLGICLGAQLIAATLGARVERATTTEIGWHDVQLAADGGEDRLLGHFAPVERIFQWHEDVFDLPAGALRLAGSAACENQAFRIGENVYGFQFHLEIDEPLVERWLHVPEHLRQIEALAIDPAAIRRETAERIARARRLSDETFLRFLGLFGPRKRARMLPSR